MDCDRRALRLLMLKEFELGRKASEATENIRRATTNKKLSYDTVRFWFNKFKKGDFDVNDEPRTGRPAEVDVNTVRELITENPRLSTRDIAELLDCHHNTIDRILHNLDLAYQSGQWLPKQKEEEEKKSGR